MAQKITRDHETYAGTRDALVFLYEEAIRNHSFDMAEILLQALAGCEQLVDESYKPALKSNDAISCLSFVKQFISMDNEKKKRLAEMLAVMDSAA